jgi:hypothetical protein
VNKIDTVITSDLTSWPFVHTSVEYNKTVKFYGPDNEKLYERNSRERSFDWIYHTEDVEYNFNKQGLRMKKDIEHVEEKYIMFSGASFTSGIGIREDRRFSELVSSRLGLDFINFSGPLYSIKLQALSFFNFLKTGFILPKILVLEYPPCTGQFFYSNGNFLLYSPDKSADRNQYPNYYSAYKKLSDTDHFVQESIIWQHIITTTCLKLGIKLIEVSFWHDDPFVQNQSISAVNLESNKEDINYCFGRDYLLGNGHPGIGLHKEMSDVIINLL